MNTPHLTIGAIVARKHELMGQASPQLVGELIDRLERVERDLLEVRSGGGAGRKETRSRLPDGVQTATDAATGRKVYERDAEAQPVGGWCQRCGCGNDVYGFAHLPVCTKRKARNAEAQPARRDLEFRAVANSICDAVERDDVDLSDIDSIASHVCAEFGAPSFEPVLWRVVTQEDHAKISEYYYQEWQAREHVNNKGGTLQTLAVIDSVTVHRPPDSNA